ncbi:MAG: MinD/ParA family protein [Clostridiales bacterium]|jgi:flagellar biosynthesis protein FlhG|nr:MinD/ParA family protein [Clostridiales bacterium]
MDQAEKLRQIVQDLKQKRNARETRKARIITVTSGKGGVGKTSFSINCGIALNNMGYRVLIIDADFGLANIDVMLGIIPEYSLFHVIDGKKSIEDVITDGPCGIKFISGGSGIWELINLSSHELETIIRQFEGLDNIADIILIDTGAGVSEKILRMVLASNEVIIVTTPEPTAITDAYALVKSSLAMNRNVAFRLVVNRAENRQEAKIIMDNFVRVSAKFLNTKIDPLGYILYDDLIVKSTKQQKPFIIEHPKSHAAKQLNDIAYVLTSTSFESNSSKHSGIKGYIFHMMNFLRTRKI